MIVSHRHKFIFIKTKKTAGTSIETMLASICGNDDIITEISEELERKEKYGINSQNTLVPYSKYSLKDWIRLILKGKRKKFNAHMNAEQASKYLGDKIWKSYYKFCFERNPWDKALSMYYWKGGDLKYGTFHNFLKLEGLMGLSNWKFYAKGDKVLVDKIYKYEEIADSLNQLSERLLIEWPLNLVDIKFKTASRKKAKKNIENLNESESKLIEEIHQREILKLNYNYSVEKK